MYASPLDLPDGGCGAHSAEARHVVTMFCVLEDANGVTVSPKSDKSHQLKSYFHKR